MKSATALEELKRRHPEWQAWLAVIHEMIEAIDDPAWEAIVPALPHQAGKVPLLAQALLQLEQRSTCRLFDQLTRAATRGDTPEMATLEAAARSGLDVSSVFQAAVNQDVQRLKEIACAAAADAEAFHAVVALLPMPFLHACNRRWGVARSESWLEGYCPVCGAWPGFAELRGIERTRHFRCGRCGAGWQIHCLFCPYCGTTDHNQLISLVPEQNSSRWVIDACHRCGGYVKGFTTLQGSPPADVILEDLGSIELDVAAADRGYKRPKGAGYFLNIRVSQNGAARGSA
jgi:FdhE protein